MTKVVQFRHSLWLFVLLFTQGVVHSQTDSTLVVNNFKGTVSVTNNGISMIPSFTLGKPAAIVDLSVGRRISFDPQVRFSLEGKPWSFVFWWRYKVLKPGKFQLNMGIHPAVLFSNRSITTDSVSKSIIECWRYLAGELTPVLLISKNVSIGMNYLYSYGLEKEINRNTHFISVGAGFSNIKLFNQFFIRIAPQFYYLKLDKQEGVYFSSVFNLTKKNFPLSLSSIINKSIQSNITGSKNFIWNITLNYSFNKFYIEQ